MPENFPLATFRGTLRPSQREVVEVAQKELASGSRKLHIVAPPGSGKTVLGLYLWSQVVRRPCIVLSPNSAIQSQWIARTDLFRFPKTDLRIASANPSETAFINSLTYQAVSMPARGKEQVELEAGNQWAESLIEQQQVTSLEEANTWIGDLKNNNPEYYERQFSRYRKRVRDRMSKGGHSISLLHESSKSTLQSLRDLGVGLLILDECHHLLGHWGRVLADALPFLGNPIVVGLTATPPDTTGKDEKDVLRYHQFLGEIDYEVPVPSVVKDGFLAPYQDLAYFVRPTANELTYIATADQQLADILTIACATPVSATSRGETVDQNHDVRLDAGSANLVNWLTDVLTEFRLPTGTVESWSKFERRDPKFALAARQFLASRGAVLPSGVPPLTAGESPEQVPMLEYCIPVLDRFVRHHLNRSPNPDHQTLAKRITANLRMLGIQITESGSRPCASPVSRVLAYSNNKADALIPILKTEMENLGPAIRAVVVADFERSSAVSAELHSLMHDETGGAIAAFRKLLTDPETDQLEPVLITGSTILIDDEIEVDFLTQCRQWLGQRNLQVELQSNEVDTFRQIQGSGSDWSPRVYVEMVTELFQQGLTKCLIGTRGLLGEGWDANKINVLIDLTTVTTSMSINQLRGRSFRLDPEWKEKTANNWDVVCLAAEFNKGFDDYGRFKSKHKNLYGVSDDGAIEKGVGHVHPAFTELKPEGLESSLSVINAEMLQRSSNRNHVRQLWKIGEPFLDEQITAVEVKLKGNGGGFPPVGKASDPWSDQSLTTAIATAVIGALRDLGHIETKSKMNASTLAGGYVRIFLKKASPEEHSVFASAMKQVLGPLERPRYVIPRSISVQTQTFLSKMLPEVVGKYFRRTEVQFAMLHAVPDLLAKRKSDVAVFERYWNQYVSPGKAAYALRGDGERMVTEARKAQQSPDTILHDKEVFL